MLPPLWIIPARAGFTETEITIMAVFEDHPRSRGVYRLAFQTVPGLLGSSPLARGLHIRCADSATRRRIIPARAGFTT